MVKNKKLDFIEKAKSIHGNKYDYSKAEYINCETKVCIICPEHGEFWQTPYVHNNLKCGCPKCGHVKTNNAKKLNKQQFIEKAREVQGDKYDYSKVEYINSKKKVCVICPEHGEFWQAPSSHLNGQGCPKCFSNKKRILYSFNKQQFIEKAKSIHGNKYDYSKINYVNANTKVCIICPEHGEFWQTPYVHNNLKCGCPKCGRINASLGETMKVEDFINKAREVHGDKYDYSKVEYVKSKIPVRIICRKHGEFLQTPDAHIHGSGCQICSNSKSTGEEEILKFLKEICNESIETRNRNVIKPQELDIFIPSKKVAIEFDGLRWHSELFNKDKNYHIYKTEQCKKNGIALIHIFEDEWTYHTDIVKEKLKHILKADTNKKKIYARNCYIKEISKKETKLFLLKYHIQGYSKSTVNYGAFFGNEIVGVMQFKKINNKNEWELTRFASNYNYICCGVGGKLFSYFVKNYNPEYVKSFADRRWTIDEENNLYTKIGFKLDKTLSPDYKYINIKNQRKRIHKFNFRKQILHKKYGFPLTMTETEMTEKLGYYKIYDCGLLKYVWKKN